MKVLGLDIGSKTIGIAASDPFGWTAQGVKTLERSSLAHDCLEIQKIIQEREIERIIIGLPLKMDGTEGSQAVYVREFASNLAKYTPEITIQFWDERLSTVAAERGLLEADLSRRKRKKVIDKMAAVFILQGYLDSHAGGELPL